MDNANEHVIATRVITNSHESQAERVIAGIPKYSDLQIELGEAVDEPWHKTYYMTSKTASRFGLEQAQGFVNVPLNLVFMRPQMHVVSLTQRFSRYRVSRMEYSVIWCMSCR